MDEETLFLARTLVDEVVGAVGLPKVAPLRTLAWRLFRPLMSRLAAMSLTFDRILIDQGLPKASEWMLSHFCTPIAGKGCQHIPAEGPLLVASNHPGAYDALVVFSQLGRREICWISTEIPFLENLPHTRQHVIFASRKRVHHRMAAMRAAIRHLQAGGVLLYFGAGHRDPDPAVYPGAAEMMDHWLEGIDFFFKHVHGLRLLPTVVSEVVSPKWAHHPITWLRRKQIDRQRLAEFGQVITQLLAPGRLLISPSISFGPPVTAADLQPESEGGSLLPGVIARQKQLLFQHMNAVQQSAQERSQ
ncbi:MAG: hypothetical protein JXB85_13180 [Anaerolineales bacterium]|nr:hypothetical protein [Anaerolineales bacterium]